ncbi:MAG: hypothetical protein Q7J09_04935 [Methanocalculus sp.]|uniref:hypothetical protein n=1 Tax=Methanocalculus sp. TaxID=2004547 RepID=UPI00271A3B3C|nr:hypothetical protein [Methanocalculus sp.]MDO9539330.1 hypothetical protein [Methanocalculus sp.]
MTLCKREEYKEATYNSRTKIEITPFCQSLWVQCDEREDIPMIISISGTIRDLMGIIIKILQKALVDIICNPGSELEPSTDPLCQVSCYEQIDAFLDGNMTIYPRLSH